METRVKQTSVIQKKQSGRRRMGTGIEQEVFEEKEKQLNFYS